MNVKTMKSNKTINLILAIILFVAGIMFCISPALGEQWVSLVIGIALACTSGYYLYTAIWHDKKLILGKAGRKDGDGKADAKAEDTPAKTSTGNESTEAKVETKPKTNKTKKKA